jgi:hypothetical protein
LPPVVPERVILLTVGLDSTCVDHTLAEPDITLFTRTMTIEAYRYAPLPDKYFMVVNPANIDAYHAAIARELAA